MLLISIVQWNHPTRAISIILSNSQERLYESHFPYYCTNPFIVLSVRSTFIFDRMEISFASKCLFVHSIMLLLEYKSLIVTMDEMYLLDIVY